MSCVEFAEVKAPVARWYLYKFLFSACVCLFVRSFAVFFSIQFILGPWPRLVLNKSVT